VSRFVIGSTRAMPVRTHARFSQKGSAKPGLLAHGFDDSAVLCAAGGGLVKPDW